MKLYFTPGACSLADHIALLETGQPFSAEAVDLRTKRTVSGRDFREINPKGYVPALVLDSGEVLTENIAVLDWIAGAFPVLRPGGDLARTRQLEMLAFISTEIHRAFKPFWHGGSKSEQEDARATIARLLQFASGQVRGEFLFGAGLSVADCYLYVMLRWAEKFGVDTPEPLLRLQWRMEQRPSVQAALARESAAAAQKPLSLDRRVRENPTEHRFERPIHNEAIAAAYFRDEDGKLVFIHTEVPVEFSGLGIGSELARGALDLVRTSGRKAVLVCPFMVHFANAHPEYADVVVG